VQACRNMTRGIETDLAKMRRFAEEEYSWDKIGKTLGPLYSQIHERERARVITPFHQTRQVAIVHLQTNAAVHYRYIYMNLSRDR